MFAEFFRAKPRAHWMERLEAEDVPHTPVYNMLEVFEDDLRRTRRVTLEEWRSRPWHEKLVERAASLIRWQL